MRWGSALRANRELKNCLKTMELTKMIRLLFIARKVWELRLALALCRVLGIGILVTILGVIMNGVMTWIYLLKCD